MGLRNGKFDVSASGQDGIDSGNVISTQFLCNQETIKDTFDMFDENKDGKISKDELRKVFQNMGKQASEEELSNWMENVDENGDGVIEFKEFLVKCAVIVKELQGNATSFVERAFKEFDTDGNGYITSQEMESVLTRLSGEKLTQTDITEIMRQVDPDGDGKITLQEFSNVMRNQQ